nr:Fic family protein [Legionella sp. 27cVA30]
MEQWAGTTVCKLSELDTNDIGKVTEFLTFVFYELTEIHPFANANGRTATCLINLFLRAFDYPSIVLRHPGERKNQNSQYQQAFAQIDSSLLPLQKLIHTRIVEAQKNVFEDKKLKKLIEIRVGFSDLLQQIKRKHPTFDVNRFQQESAGARKPKWP